MLAPLGEKNRGLAQRVGITDLVKHILIRWGDLRNHDLRVGDALRDFLEDDAGSEHFARVVHLERKFLSQTSLLLGCEA